MPLDGVSPSVTETGALDPIVPKEVAAATRTVTDIVATTRLDEVAWGDSLKRRTRFLGSA